MIQRIQSLYLFIGAALLSATLFMPLWQLFYGPGMTYTLDAFSISNTLPLKTESVQVENTAYIAAGLVLTILLSFFIILQFKKRELQIKLCLLNAVLILLTLGVIYWKISVLNKIIPGEYGIAFFFPFPAAILNILAIRSIKKDEELVRSADRIR